MKSICTAILLQFVFPVTIASAGERTAKDWELNVWGLSHHLESAPQGRAFNEVNPGIGIRKYFDKMSGFEVFVDANFVSKNSTSGQTALAGIGGQYPVFSTQQADILLGAVVGAVSYENTWDRQTYVTPGAYPFVGARYKDVALTVGYIPGIKVNGKATYEAIFGYASIRF